VTLLERLSNARLVIAFTGAGMSAESGVPTFRSAGGLWTRFRPEELANLDAFLANPELVWSWYQARRAVILACTPNRGHHALFDLESLVPRVTVVTQNIDGLHQRAGSTDVIELHGNIRRNYCQQCKRRFDDEAMLVGDAVRRCPCGGMIRPDVVWFGETLPVEAVRRAERHASEANVMFVIGTSGLVYPAANLPTVARDSGAYVVEINPEETPLSSVAHAVIRKPCGEALSDIVAALRMLRRPPM